METRGRKKKYIHINRDRLIDLYNIQKLPISLVEGLLDISYPTLRKALQFHNLPIRPKNYPWNEKLRRKHGILLRRLHAKARYERMKND